MRLSACRTLLVREQPIRMLCALLLASLVPAGGDPVTFASLLAELVDRRALAEFPVPAYTCKQFSSYDRSAVDPAHEWFANADAGQYLRSEDHDGRSEAVLMDAAGPGALVRLWSANPKGVLRVYLDGNPTPTLEVAMDAWLGGRAGVPAPLAQGTSRGWTSYLPIPYSDRCVVTCDDPQGVYYQCNYRTYASGTTVASLSPGDLATQARGIAECARQLSEPSVAAQAGLERFDIVLSAQAGGGAVRSFEVPLTAPDAGGAAITEFALTIEPEGGDHADAMTELLRSTLLSITFDGVETVRTPLGDFFGSSPGLNPYHSAPFTVAPSGELACRWVMPFRERAQLRVEVLGGRRARFHGRIASEPHAFSDRTLYFHARWKRETAIPTRPMRDWNYVTIEGRGVFVGDMLSVANPVKAWWGEGDEKIYVDGEAFPSHFGTGTEDYYGYAWCDPTPFEHPLHGQTRCDGPGNFGHTSVNRFRRLDAIPFERALRFDMEIWHWTGDIEVDYTATTYFYADLDARDDDALNEAALRAEVPKLVYEPYRVAGALECEALEVLARSPELALGSQALADTAEGKWSGGEQLWVRATAVGQFVELALPVESDGRYEVILYPTRSWDYGTLQCYLDGRLAGQPLVTFNAEAEAKIGVPRPTSLGVFELTAPRAVLRVEAVGTHPRSRPPHYYFGIDCVVLRSQRP